MLTMNALIQFSAIAIAIVSVVSASPVDGGKCAMYGNCSPIPGKLAPCAHSAPAEKPNFDMSVCSMYQNLACCDADSYKIVSSNIAQLTVLFQRCPACLMNLEALFCGIFCSPNQADFVSGIQVNSSTGSPFVQSANVAIASEFGNGMFDSCLDVQFGATGLTVFSAVFGNPSNASELYNFLFLNPTSPTISALVVENTDQGGLDDTAAIQCNSTNPNYRCSVVDCPACAAQYQMKFLVGVNSTQTNCASTGRTVFLKANTSKGDSPSVSVGDCDQGPLTYTVSSSSSGEVTVNVVFYSSNIEDASPPSCSFAWTGDYLPPPPSAQPGDSPSLLPGCSVADSREGYHMTYYWFYLLDWNTQ